MREAFAWRFRLGYRSPHSHESDLNPSPQRNDLIRAGGKTECLVERYAGKSRHQLELAETCIVCSSRTALIELACEASTREPGMNEERADSRCIRSRIEQRIDSTLRLIAAVQRCPLAPAAGCSRLTIDLHDVVSPVRDQLGVDAVNLRDACFDLLGRVETLAQSACGSSDELLNTGYIFELHQPKHVRIQFFAINWRSTNGRIPP